MRRLPRSWRTAGARRPAPTALLTLALLAGASAAAASAIDGFDFAHPEDAARYQSLLAEFRCPKCLNESLASSGAPIAVDLRRTVRRLLAEGATDAAIRDHLSERYGDFVLYDPPFRVATYLLWLSPLALLAVVALVLARSTRARARAPATEAEGRFVERLLRGKGGEGEGSS